MLTILIVINSFILAIKKYEWRLEHKLDVDESVYTEKDWKFVISTMITIVFIIEFLLKVIAMGFVLEEGTYLRDGWNKLDFIVVIVG